MLQQPPENTSPEYLELIAGLKQRLNKCEGGIKK
jgi:hypothetical protein